MTKRNAFRGLMRIVCLITGTIGMYKTDIVHGLIFLGFMVLVFWIVPEIGTRLCIGKRKYDGEVFVDSIVDGKTNLKLDIYEPDNIVDSDELLIKVNIKEEK